MYGAVLQRGGHRSANWPLVFSKCAAAVSRSASPTSLKQTPVSQIWIVPVQCSIPGYTLEVCHIPCPLDCKLSEWSPWSACSASCGSGLKTRSKWLREKAFNGGRPCPRLDLKNQVRLPVGPPLHVEHHPLPADALCTWLSPWLLHKKAEIIPFQISRGIFSLHFKGEHIVLQTREQKKSRNF